METGDLMALSCAPGTNAGIQHVPEGNALGQQKTYFFPVVLLGQGLFMEQTADDPPEPVPGSGVILLTSERFRARIDPRIRILDDSSMTGGESCDLHRNAPFCFGSADFCEHATL